MTRERDTPNRRNTGRNGRRGGVIPPAPPAPPAPPQPPPDPRDRPLSDDENAFLEQLLVDRNRRAAYRRAFPDANWVSCDTSSARMLRRPHVRHAYRQMRLAQFRRCNASADEVVRELTRVAYSDPLHIADLATGRLLPLALVPFDTRRAIASVEVARERQRRVTTRNGRQTVRTVTTECVVKYRFHPKVAALQELVKRFGLDAGLTPIDVLLAALPRDLAAAVRAELDPSRNDDTPSPTGV